MLSRTAPLTKQYVPLTAVGDPEVPSTRGVAPNAMHLGPERPQSPAHRALSVSPPAPFAYAQPTTHGDRAPSPLDPWQARSAEFARLSLSQQPSGDDIDAFKLSLINTLRNNPSVKRALTCASYITSLHKKPNHAQELERMIHLLLPGDPNAETLICAAQLYGLGEWKSPAALMRGGQMTEEQKKLHVFPIYARAAEEVAMLPDGQPLAEAIAGRDASSLAPYLHACRDIADMDAERDRRIDATHPKGRLSLEEILVRMQARTDRPGRDAEVTTRLCDAYAALRRAE